MYAVLGYVLHPEGSLAHIHVDLFDHLPGDRCARNNVAVVLETIIPRQRPVLQ
jgi:hypothetical protein